MIDFLFRVRTLIVKELLSILKDPASRIVLFMPVLVQGLLFGYAATYDLTNVAYAVLDQSGSPTSAELLARLDGTGFFRRARTLRSADEIARAVDLQEATVVVHVPQRLEQELAAGRTVAVQLILDARNSTTANSAAAAFGAVVDAFNAGLPASRAGTAPALALETRAWFNPNLETRWSFLPAFIATLSILQTMLLTALSVAREREQGTFDQLLVTPLSPTEIMLGKAIPPLAIGLVQSTLVLLIARFWFAIPMAGSVATLYVAMTVFVVAGVGIGLCISAFSATMQQAMLYTFVLLMPMMLLSGLATPVSSMPQALQVATLANPIRFGVDMARRVYLEDAGLAALAADFVPLVAITALTLPVAAWLFRNRLA